MSLPIEIFWLLVATWFLRCDKDARKRSDPPPTVAAWEWRDAHASDGGSHRLKFEVWKNDLKLLVPPCTLIKQAGMCGFKFESYPHLQSYRDGRTCACSWASNFVLFFNRKDECNCAGELYAVIISCTMLYMVLRCSWQRFALLQIQTVQKDIVDICGGYLTATTYYPDQVDSYLKDKSLMLRLSAFTVAESTKSCGASPHHKRACRCCDSAKNPVSARCHNGRWPDVGFVKNLCSAGKARHFAFWIFVDSLEFSVLTLEDPQFSLCHESRAALAVARCKVTEALSMISTIQSSRIRWSMDVWNNQ